MVFCNALISGMYSMTYMQFVVINIARKGGAIYFFLMKDHCLLLVTFLLFLSNSLDIRDMYHG